MGTSWYWWIDLEALSFRRSYDYPRNLEVEQRIPMQLWIFSFSACFNLNSNSDLQSNCSMLYHQRQRRAYRKYLSTALLFQSFYLHLQRLTAQRKREMEGGQGELTTFLSVVLVYNGRKQRTYLLLVRLERPHHVADLRFRLGVDLRGGVRPRAHVLRRVRKKEL